MTRRGRSCGDEWWFYPAVVAGVTALAYGGYHLAGLAAEAAPPLIIQPR